MLITLQASWVERKHEVPIQFSIIISPHRDTCFFLSFLTEPLTCLISLNRWLMSGTWRLPCILGAVQLSLCHHHSILSTTTHHCSRTSHWAMSICGHHMRTSHQATAPQGCMSAAWRKSDPWMGWWACQMGEEEDYREGCTGTREELSRLFRHEGKEGKKASLRGCKDNRKSPKRHFVLAFWRQVVCQGGEAIAESFF